MSENENESENEHETDEGAEDPQNIKSNENVTEEIVENHIYTIGDIWANNHFDETVIEKESDESFHCEVEEEIETHVYNNRSEEDDPYKWMVLVVLDLFDHKIIKLLIILCFLFHFAQMLPFYYFVIQDRDPDIIIKYANCILFQIVGCTQCVYQFSLSIYIRKAYHITQEFIHSDLYPPKFREFFNKYGVMINNAFKMITVSLSLVGISQIILFLTRDIVYSNYIFAKWFNSTPPFWFVLCYAITCFIMYEASLMTAVAYVYTCFHAQIQSMSFRAYFSAINDGFEDVEEEELYENEQFQNEVTKRLKFCLEMYNIMKQYQQYGHKVLYWTILLYTGVFSGLIFAIMWGFFWMFSKDTYLTYIMQAVTVSFAISFLSLVGQVQSNESDELNDAVWNVPWYYWNRKNQKLLIILMTHTITTYKVRAGNMVVVDYSLIIRSLRLAYSLMTFMNLLKQLRQDYVA